MHKSRIVPLLAFAALLASITLSPYWGHSLAAPATQPQPGTIQRDITYCVGAGVELKMDVYYPRLDAAKPAPAILYLHGGGWVAGDKSEGAGFAAQTVPAGYLLASINYRLAPQHRWPAQIEDAKCAVRHLRANAARYGLDPARIAAWGSSAGGHLAALLGLAGKEAGLEGNGGHAEQSSGVAAVIDLFGPTDLTKALDPGNPIDLVESLIGNGPGAADRLRAASPLTYVKPGAPPFLILHGDKDVVVPLSQSQDLHNRLTAAGASSTLVVVKNAGHAFVPVGGALDPNLLQLRQTILDFLEARVRGAAPTSRTFPETGKTVSGPFLEYWQRNGALPQQGYPISAEMQEISETDGKPYTVQYFERAVFEHHPENAGKPSEVLLSLLGVFRYKSKYPLGRPSGVVGQAQPGTCAATHDDSDVDSGRGFSSEAPQRQVVGKGLVLTGRVLSSRDCAPIAGVKLEMRPEINNDHPEAQRATLYTDANGRYRFESDFPAHIHMRVSAHGFKTIIANGYHTTPGKSVDNFDIVLAPDPACRWFAETGQALCGKFLDYWNTHGALPQQGFPISDQFAEVSDLNGKAYTVQYFERVVLEYHPENPAPYDVLLSQLGTFRYRQKYGIGEVKR